MKLKWVLLIAAVAIAAGTVLVAFGTLLIYHGADLRYISGTPIDTPPEEYEPVLMIPPREWIAAGVLMVATGAIAISVTLASVIVFWKRESQIDAAQPPKEV